VFCSESRGLGHLKRLSSIARELAERHAVLVVTSDSISGDFIRAPVEYVRLPPLVTSDRRSAQNWDQGVFMEGQLDIVLSLRTELLATTFKTYRPHAMITDFFATGRGSELLPHLRYSTEPCLNYLVLRGVLGSDIYAGSRVFSPQAIRMLSRYYQRLLVACDARIFQAAEYQLPEDITRKSINVGYVYTPIDDDLRLAARAARKVRSGTPWVVCAAGSGLSSERLIERCYQLAMLRNDCKFTLVLGPKSRLKLAEGLSLPPHITVRRYEPELEVLLASCDIAIIHGGYNSLLESVYGGASVIVVPNEAEEEQFEHARRLAGIADVCLTDLAGLEQCLESCLARQPLALRGSPPMLDVDGARRIAALVNQDFDSANGREQA
jgi:predicted glycosyltransferase